MSPLIYDILLKFRAHKGARTADIEKALLNMAVAPVDRVFFGFLWVSDIASDNPEICVYTFARVVFSLSSSPFLLNATFRYHLTRSEVESVYMCRRSVEESI